MVSVDKGYYYGASDVARDIWNAIEQPKKVADLIDYLVATYDVNRSLCVDETLSFLEDLMAEDLLQVGHGPPS